MTKLIYCLVLGVLASATLPESYICLKGEGGQFIPFFLVSRDKKTVLYSENGKLDIEKLEPHQNKIFRLEFENHVDVFTYGRNLYFYNQKGEEFYIQYNYITYDLLQKNSSLLFHLKRTENLVNPSKPTKTGKSKADSVESPDK